MALKTTEAEIDVMTATPSECPSLSFMFEQAAAATPDAVAVFAEGRSVSFAQLAMQASKLASYLHDKGVRPESQVGLHLPRGIDCVLSMLALLKLGAAYVPLDPSQPTARLNQIVHQANPLLVLSQSAVADLQPINGELVLLDQIAWQECSAMREQHFFPDSPAYTIFTSGSTGVPKGVQISHRSAHWLLESLQASGVIRPQTARVGWNASIAFDASVQQWLRLCRGDSLYLLDEAVRRDAYAMLLFIRQHQLQDIDLTPSHAALLIEGLRAAPMPGLRLLVGGEPISPALWSQLRSLTSEGIDAINLYGPTETTVDALTAEISGDALPHLGSAMPRVEIRVFDAQFRAVIDGEVGQLCLAGPGLARCYLGQPGLTASRFIPMPDGDPGARMYLTGDLVRLQGGRIDYIGRTDQQVKVRGHRVELGEIEAALQMHPDVTTAVVCLHEDSLSAYICIKEAPIESTLQSIQQGMRVQLPVWMQPTHYVVLQQMPLSVSGKTDRQSVAAMRLHTPTEADGKAQAVAAGERRTLKNSVAHIWCDVLGLKAIGDDDDFFDLGGHSLAAMQVSNRLHAQFRCRFPTRMLFESPNLIRYVDAVESRLQPLLVTAN